MKKSSLLLISSIIYFSSISGMEIQPHKSFEKYNKEYPRLCTLQEKGFFIIAQNIYASANHDAQVASRILHDISLINKNLYKALDKERNDPVTARDIIIQFALSKDGFNPNIARKLIFRGAQKCLALSQQLYDRNLISDEIRQLFKEGAIINYASEANISPLSYWTQKNNIEGSIWAYYQTVQIMHELIALGADPNCESIWNNNSFVVAIKKQKSDKLTILLKYYTCMGGTSTTPVPVWSEILNLYSWGSDHVRGYKECPELIDLFITKIPKESCSLGLMACTSTEDLRNPLRTQLMQKFIDRGADAGRVLPYLLKAIQLWGPDYSQSTFIQEFNMLCDNKAFNKEALTTLQDVRQLFDSLITKLEKNSPK